VDLKEGIILPPIRLTPEQEDICERLFLFSQRTNHKQDLSVLFKGAVYAFREECRCNPDWIAQSAHSLREILYPFYSGKNSRKDAFTAYGSVTIEDKLLRQALNRVYGKITDIAHHIQPISIEDYENLIEDFQRVLSRALDRQVDVHNQIDNFFSKNKPQRPETTKYD